jgi:hypothetical protein
MMRRGDDVLMVGIGFSYGQLMMGRFEGFDEVDINVHSYLDPTNPLVQVRIKVKRIAIVRPCWLPQYEAFPLRDAQKVVDLLPTHGHRYLYRADSGHPITGEEDTFAIAPADLKRILDPAPPPEKKDAHKESPGTLELG